MPAVILALAASPREGGNTDRLLDAFLEAWGGDGFSLCKRHLHRLRINPCRACGACIETGVCAQEDDMALIYRDLENASALVLASPVWFLGLPAQAKMMIDRCQPLWAAARLGRTPVPPVRPAAFLSVAGQKGEGLFECSLRTARAFFTTAGFRLRATLTRDGLDEDFGGMVSDPLLEEAFRCGRVLRDTILNR